MADLLEVVLEGVARSKVYQVLIEVLSKAGRIMEVQCTEEIPLPNDGTISEEDVKIFLSLSDDASLMIKLDKIEVEGIVIPSVFLRVVKYSDKLDIDFNFNERDVVGAGTVKLMEKLHDTMTAISDSYNVDNWYGGIEPASDQDTRYFTRKESGPLVRAAHIQKPPALPG